MKTQGPPLVHTSTKPKPSPWSAQMHQLRRPLSRVQVPPRELSPHHLEKPLIRSKSIFTPHNHQSRTFACQDDPLPDFMTRPSIRCSSHLLLIIIRGGTLQVKRTIPTLVRQELQPREIQTQLLINIKGEAPHKRRKPH